MEGTSCGKEKILRAIERRMSKTQWEHSEEKDWVEKTANVGVREDSGE